MSAWIVIQPGHMNAYQVGAMMEALRSAALAEGQEDPFDEVMHARANYVRARISKKILISSTPYAVPPELESQTCLLILEAMQARLPGLSLSEDHKTLISTAKKDLDIAATPDLPIDLPDDPVQPTVQSSGSATVVTQPSSTLNRNSLKGL